MLDKKKMAAALCAGFGLLALPSAAQAAPIIGSVEISAGGTLATSRSFNGASEMAVGGGRALVTSASGDIAAAGFTFGLLGLQHDICYSAGCDPEAPVADFFVFTSGDSTLAFDLTSLSIERLTATSLALVAEGVLKLTGYDATPGVWRLTAQTAGASTFSFSSSTVAQSVAQSVAPPPPPLLLPEPATLGFIAAGMLGLGLLRQRRGKPA